MTHLLEMILNSIQILDKTFGQCSLGLARFTNVIFMLTLPFIFRQYLKKIKNEDEQVSLIWNFSHSVRDRKYPIMHVKFTRSEWENIYVIMTLFFVLRKILLSFFY